MRPKALRRGQVRVQFFFFQTWGFRGHRRPAVCALSCGKWSLLVSHPQVKRNCEWCAFAKVRRDASVSAITLGQSTFPKALAMPRGDATVSAMTQERNAGFASFVEMRVHPR